MRIEDIFLSIKNFTENHTTYALDENIFNQHVLESLKNGNVSEKDILSIKKFRDHVLENNYFYQLNDDELEIINNLVL